MADINNIGQDVAFIIAHLLISINSRLRSHDYTSIYTKKTHYNIVGLNQI